MDFLRPWLLAIKANTRIPVDAQTDDLTEPRAAHLPGVGWILGGAACIAFAILGLLLHASALAPLVAAIGCTMATAALTNARDELKLRGAFANGGEIALFLALAMKIALLAVLAGQSEPGVLVALFGAHVVSRCAPLLAEKKLDKRDAWIAIAWCAAPVLLAFAVRGIAFALLPLVFAAIAAWASRRSDASQQACEIAFYLGAAISA